MSKYYFFCYFKFNMFDIMLVRKDSLSLYKIFFLRNNIEIKNILINMILECQNKVDCPFRELSKKLIYD